MVKADERELVKTAQEADLDTLLRTEVAAAFLTVKPFTLYKWRKAGSGPKFVHLSKTRVAYRKRALLEFIEAREHSSTSSVGQPAAPVSPGGDA